MMLMVTVAVSRLTVPRIMIHTHHPPRHPPQHQHHQQQQHHRRPMPVLPSNKMDESSTSVDMYGHGDGMDASFLIRTRAGFSSFIHSSHRTRG